jgi:hypothetical protein
MTWYKVAPKGLKLSEGNVMQIKQASTSGSDPP